MWVGIIVNFVVRKYRKYTALILNSAAALNMLYDSNDPQSLQNYGLLSRVSGRKPLFSKLISLNSIP